MRTRVFPLTWRSPIKRAPIALPEIWVATWRFLRRHQL